MLDLTEDKRLLDEIGLKRNDQAVEHPKIGYLQIKLEFVHLSLEFRVLEQLLQNG